MEEVKNDNTVATPATDVTITAENKVDSVVTTTAPATETKDTTTATAENIEATQKPKDSLPKGVKKELWELREKVRMLNAKLEQSSVAPAPTPTPTAQEQVNPLDDPEKWGNQVQERATTEAERRILAKMEMAKEADRLQRETDQGLEFLLSKKEVSDDPDARTEISEILQRPDMSYVAAKYPAKAAQMAYAEFIATKGISPERKNTVASNIAATVTTSSTAKPMGPRVWTRKDIEIALSDHSNPKYAEIEAEIDRAIKERRVK